MNFNEASQELDWAVAEALGWKRVQYPGGFYWDEGEQGPIPRGKFVPRFSGSFRPSRDWNDAMEAAEKVGLFLTSSLESGGDCWLIYADNHSDLIAHAPTGQLAICGAILKSKENP